MSVVTTGQKTETVPFSAMAELPILVVDDLHLLRQLLKSYLEKEGFSNIHVAEDGVQAVEMIENLRPALVVLDIVMPNMDGFEVCKTVRSNPKFSNMPIIVQTGMEESGERLRVFQEGANDLVIKPVNGAELVARVKVHLQNGILQRQQRLTQERMINELEAARRVQQSILPAASEVKQLEEDVPLSIAAHYRASSELGGDFWGMQALGDGKLAAYSVDFTGHGVASALNTFRLHTLLSDSQWDWSDPVCWMQSVNSRLSKILPVGQFATIFYVVVDTKNAVMNYTSAGSPPIIIGGNDGTLNKFYDTAGLPAGILDTAEYEMVTAPFPHGSQLVIYSDALIETQSADGELMDDKLLLSVVDDVLELTDSNEKISKILNAFPANDLDPLPDDLTLICLTHI